MTRRIALLFALIGVVTLGSGALPAQAAVPSNDLISNATRIASVPYLIHKNTSEAHADGPTARGCNATRASVFFKFRPVHTRQLVADTFGSHYDTVLSVWTGPLTNLVRVACNDDYSSLQSAVHFRASAGKQYIFMAAACCGSSAGGGGSLTFSVRGIPKDPPTATVNITGGTVDSGVATLTGILDCNHRMMVSLEGTLRETVSDFY